ncbi:MAG: DUF177 domain-containing protein [FCB group bacterium]|nr:DUF177 domain-containing protein [FCB group bacterium]
MDKLRMPLSTVPAKGLPVNVTVTEEDLRPDGAKELSVEPVTVSGVLAPADTDYLFRGDISVEYRHTCDRCLEEAKIPSKVEVTWFFTPRDGSEELSDADEDMEILEDDERPMTYENGELDLAPHVWEEIVLTAPSKFLCREDCAGLCPRCGTNLNREQCGCPPEEEEKLGNQGLKGLANLFPNLKKDSEQ